MTPFRPALFDSLRGYQASDFRADLAAGVTVGVVALPLAMAFGIASGVSPAQGLVTAIIAGFIVALLGGSKVQIAGPAGAFVGLLYTLGERIGAGNLLLATMLAGVLLVLAGALRLGRIIRFVPVVIITGFTNGIAVIIALQQLRDFFGLPIEKMPADFFAQIHTLASHAQQADVAALLLGFFSLLILQWWPKSFRQYGSRWQEVAKQIPGTVIVLLLGIVLISCDLIQVPTIGSRFGGIPASLPYPTAPDVDWSKVREILVPAISIALLCGIESLLCARMADSLIRERHNADQELIAQGVANMLVPLFGGIAATGTIARTVTNVRSGARSPISAVVHSITLMLIVLVAAPLAAKIPLAALAAVLLFVAYHMGDWQAFARLKAFSVPHRTLMIGSFALTVVFDLTIAVQVGVGLACLLFLHRMASLTNLQWLEPLRGERRETIALCQLSGPLFFGSVDRMEAVLDANEPRAQHIILDMQAVSYLDTSALEVLTQYKDVLATLGGGLAICGAPDNVASLIARSGLLKDLVGQTIYKNLGDAKSAFDAAWPH
ncbi:MAG: SulP family inorganic anion transporter [Burkholderiaceae bacterium]|jgi:SulP family sulfate permease